MKPKHLLSVVALSLLLSGCGAKTTTPGAVKPSASTKILVNELSIQDRPFTVLVPHATNKLFTFVSIGASKAKEASLDLEYQSGDLLKGAKTNLESPIAEPYMKAIILGSCSTGGKCTFDKDLKTGTIKFRLSYANLDAIHVLKGDFTFVSGQNNLPDGKVSFEPSKGNLKDNIILMNSLGLPVPYINGNITLYPIVLSAVSDKNIAGTLVINQSGSTSASIYDGKAYQSLKISQKGESTIITINHKPWSMSADITRDDDKGTKEHLNLYLLGPIVLTK